MTDPVPAAPLWKRLMQHAVFPLLVYVALTQVFRENYPFSHYPMYSRPNSESVQIQFLADGDNKPLPVAWHTGVTSSKVAKLHANRMKKHHDEKAAAIDVLHFLRETNAGRRGRELPERIRLVETTITLDNGRVVETQRVLVEDKAPSKS